MSDNKRKLKNSGTTSEVSLDKTKEYKYDKTGALVVATVVGDNDIVFSGSKSSLRRLSDLERNVSILAATLTTTDGTSSDGDDASYDGIFAEPARFKSTTRFDGSVSVYAAVAMNNNKITGLGTPTATTDAATKSYADTVAATAQSQATSAAATDATTKANAAKPVAGTGISVSGTTVTNTLSTSGGNIGGAIAVTGAITATGSLTVSSGNVAGGGIILADDGDIVDLNDSFCAMRFTGGVRIHAGNRTGAAVITLASSGAITATGEITAYYSDINLKKDIVEIQDPIAKVMSLRGVTFRPNQTALDLGIVDKEEVGVIAQEVEAVLPQLVTPSAFPGFKTVKYDKLTALLLEAVKAQQLQIDALRAEISKLGGSAVTEL